jgi:hypothetical protein
LPPTPRNKRKTPEPLNRARRSATGYESRRFHNAYLGQPVTRRAAMHGLNASAAIRNKYSIGLTRRRSPTAGEIEFYFDSQLSGRNPDLA